MSFPPSSKPSPALALTADERSSHPNGTVLTCVSTIEKIEELYLYDRTFTQIARGVGALERSLEPGVYRLRQRVGDAESVEEFTIPSDTSSFTYIPRQMLFPSSIQTSTNLPIHETSTDIKDAVAFRSRLRLLVRLSRDSSREDFTEADFSHLRTEVDKLGIEALNGELLFDILTEGILDIAQEAFILEIPLEEGVYVLAQTGECGRKRCMPIRLIKGWATNIDFLLVRDLESIELIAINLDSATIIFQHGAELNFSKKNALKVEVARKALSFGRSISGWAGKNNEAIQATAEINPLLALIDAQLRLNSKLVAEKIQIAAHIDATAEVLGSRFPDVLALRAAYRETFVNDPLIPLPMWTTEELIGPPLLRRSWEQLVSAYGGTKALNQVIPDDSVIDNTATWFIWVTTTDTGVEISSDLKTRKPSMLQSLIKIGKSRLATFKPIVVLSKVLRGTTSVSHSGAQEVIDKSTKNISQKELKLVPRNLEESVSSLVALVDQGEMQEWLDCIQDLVEKFLPLNSPLRTDPTIQQFLVGMELVLDNVFVRTFGAEHLIRQVLASLKLPDDKVVAIVRKLSLFVMEEGSRANLTHIINLAVHREAEQEIGKGASEKYRSNLLGLRQYFLGHWFFGARRIPFINRDDGLTKVAIYGAGTVGNQVVAALRMSRAIRPVAFIDDDNNLVDRVISGLQVYKPTHIQQMVIDTDAQEILLAIPSATRARRYEILGFLERFPLRVRSVPAFMDLASGLVKVDDAQELDVPDLLGRDVVPVQVDLLQHCIKGRSVLVTGAGGSIGSELCRQIITLGPTILLLFDHSESNLYNIMGELEQCIAHESLPIRLLPILGTIRNQAQLVDVMKTWSVDTVYHAAAYKHATIVEKNMFEGVLNNVIGTLNTAQAALQVGVANFVLISTTAAVRPTNVIGKTKRLAELTLQALSRELAPVLFGDASKVSQVNKTRFTTVRFSSALGSSESVIPLFQKQIKSGGPLTVTHPKTMRYFMTIPEAAQLVIQAGSMGSGGDVFVLDMGEPVKIAELAERVIHFSGLSVRSDRNPQGDISIEFTGLRPGERLYEELLIGENIAATLHPKIMSTHEDHLSWDVLKEKLAELLAAVSADDYSRVRQLLREIVSGYTPDGKSLDRTYGERGLDP